MAPDDENTALKIQENLKAAVANLWPRPFELGALAGTVPCPQCHGSPRVRRLTPDFAKALGMDETWDFKIAKRMGHRVMFPSAGRHRRQQYLEYPGAAPNPVELAPPPGPQKAQSKGDAQEGAEDTGFKVSHSSAFSLEDYVLNYVSDDDEPRQQQ